MFYAVAFGMFFVCGLTALKFRKSEHSPGLAMAMLALTAAILVFDAIVIVANLEAFGNPISSSLPFGVFVHDAIIFALGGLNVWFFRSMFGGR